MSAGVINNEVKARTAPSPTTTKRHGPRNSKSPTNRSTVIGPSPVIMCGVVARETRDGDRRSDVTGVARQTKAASSITRASGAWLVRRITQSVGSVKISASRASLPRLQQRSAQQDDDPLIMRVCGGCHKFSRCSRRRGEVRGARGHARLSTPPPRSARQACFKAPRSHLQSHQFTCYIASTRPAPPLITCIAGIVGRRRTRT